MNLKIKALIIAMITALSIGGTVTYITSDECRNADVKILTYGKINDKDAIYWCGTNDEAEQYRLELAINIDNIDTCDQYEDGVSEQSQNKECYKEKMRTYITVLSNDRDFYPVLKPILKNKIDDQTMTPLQVETVKYHDDFAQELESIFANKYDKKNNEFSGTLIYQQPILSEVLNKKMQRIKGENKYFDFNSLDGDDFTEKVYNFLTL